MSGRYPATFIGSVCSELYLGKPRLFQIFKCFFVWLNSSFFGFFSLLRYHKELGESAHTFNTAWKSHLNIPVYPIQVLLSTQHNTFQLGFLPLYNKDCLSSSFKNISHFLQRPQLEQLWHSFLPALIMVMRVFSKTIEAFFFVLLSLSGPSPELPF